jgi:hypothetical protein
LLSKMEIRMNKSQYAVIPPSVSFHQCSIFILHSLLLTLYNLNTLQCHYIKHCSHKRRCEQHYPPSWAHESKKYSMYTCQQCYVQNPQKLLTCNICLPSSHTIFASWTYNKCFTEIVLLPNELMCTMAPFSSPQLDLFTMAFKILWFYW